MWGVCFEWWGEIKAKTALFFSFIKIVSGGGNVWWCGDFLICFSGGGVSKSSGEKGGVFCGGGYFWCRNGDFECECGMGEGVSGLRFVGLFFWIGWIFVGLFRGGIWAGLMKS